MANKVFAEMEKLQTNSERTERLNMVKEIKKLVVFKKAGKMRDIMHKSSFIKAIL